MIRILISILLLLYASTAAFAGEGQAVTLQLKWKHQFQFAGYYAALEKGFYKESGLEVKIVEGGPDIVVTKEVETSRADYGVGTSGLLLDRSAGQDFVVLGVIYQHSPAILLSVRKSGIRSVADIAGKRLLDTPGSQDIEAMLKKEGIDYSRLPRVSHQGNPTDLVVLKADVMVAYSTNEPFVLEELGEPYMAFSPRSHGIDFYGDNFFTTGRKIEQQPDQVRAFRQATLRGWRYALANKGEIVDLIREKYSRQKSREALMFEATASEALIQAELVDIGYQSQVRWQSIANVYADLGMLPPNAQVSGILYDPGKKTDVKSYWIAIGIFCLASLAFGLIAVIFLRLSRKLRNQIAEHQHIQEVLRRNDDLKSHVAKISTELQTSTTYEELARTFMSYTAPLISVEKGMIYLFDEEAKILKPIGGYASLAQENQAYSLGQGLVGQCAQEKSPMVISSPEGHYIRIHMGVGQIEVKTIVLQPIMQYDQLLGVIELAAITPFKEENHIILNGLMPVVALNIQILSRNLRTQHLLEEMSHLAKKLEEQRDHVKETEIWHRGIIEAAPDGMLVIDEHGRIVLANLQIDTMFGYETGTLIGGNIKTLVPNISHTLHIGLSKIDKPLDISHAMETVSHELPGVRQDGSVFSVEVGLSRLPALGNRGACVCVSVRDISERKRAEETLKKSERRLKTILETANEGFLSINNEAMVIEVNTSLCEILGRTPEEVIGRNLFEFVNEDNKEMFQKQIELQKQGINSVFEISLTNADGTQKSCLFNGTPLFDEARKIVGAFAMVTDITERKKVEAEMKQYLEDLEKFNRLVVGREEKMIQLKEEINELRRQLSQEPKYKIVA